MVDVTQCDRCGRTPAHEDLSIFDSEQVAPRPTTDESRMERMSSDAAQNQSTLGIAKQAPPDAPMCKVDQYDLCGHCTNMFHQFINDGWHQRDYSGSSGAKSGIQSLNH